MKSHIINILTHQPDYEYLSDKPRPAINWDTPDGNWVGIYRNEIPDKLGEEVLKYTDEFEYEVWQPDLRADKVYSHRFDDGLVHRLFPAQEIQMRYGFKRRSKLSAPSMVAYLRHYAQEHRVLLNLNGDFSYLNAQLMQAYGQLPILQTYRGTLHLPSTMMFRPRLNFLASVNYYRDHQQLKKLMGTVDYLTHMNDQYMDQLDKIYTGPRAKLTSGCDFSFWQPLDRQACRQELGLPLSKPVIFTSSLLKPLKQIDQVIKVLTALHPKYDFLLVISGHGTKAYEAHLHHLAQPLLAADKARFVGYLTGDTLKKYYNSANLFVSASVSEGGPTSSMKAIACQVPVMTTDTGNVAERMRRNNSGIIVATKDYAQWQVALERVFQGKPVRVFPRQEAMNYYDWQKVAGRFVDIYRHLNQHYYQD